MTDVDVVVVGAGPAGLSAASTVARGGARVLVLDKASEIGGPIRTSGGSWVAELEALGIPRRLYHDVQRLAFMGPTTRVDFDFGSIRCMCVTDVRGLYQFLGEQAVEAGASIRLKTAVREPLLRDGKVVGVQAIDPSGTVLEIGARIVVDASGHAAIVGRKSGLVTGKGKHGFGAEYDLFAPSYDQRLAAVVVGSAYAPTGYAWAFPRGNGRVRVGTGVLKPDCQADPREHLDRLVESDALEGAFRGASPIEYHTGLIPLDQPRRTLVGEGVLLVGDAGGQASALVGEGIRFAIQAGRMAGEVINSGLETNDLSAHALDAYSRAWRRRWGRNMDVAYAISRRLSEYGDQTWDRRVALLERLTPLQFAQGLQTNFDVPWALAVFLRNPPLWRFAASRALRGLWRPAA